MMEHRDTMGMQMGYHWKNQPDCWWGIYIMVPQVAREVGSELAYITVGGTNLNNWGQCNCNGDILKGYS